MAKKSVKQRNFYDTSFSIDDNFYQIEEDEENTPKKPRRTIKINFRKIIIIVALLVLLFLIFFIVRKIVLTPKKDEPQIVLKESNYQIKEDDKYILSFELVNIQEEGTVVFQSSNELIATVSENGEVSGISEGEAIITIIYRTKDKEIKKNVTFQILKKEDSKDNPKDNPVDKPNKQLPTLSLSFSSGQENTWTNKDVVIKTSAKSNTGGAVSLKYTVNCSKNCKYTEVKNNQITISNNGSTVVSVVATDSYNNQVTKSVTVKIDKTAPKLTLSPNNATITSNTDVTVCAKCQDNESKCKKDSVCKTYNKTTYNATLMVEDNASNTTTSQSFNVIINHDVAVTKVTLDKTSLTIGKGGNAILKATITPDNATDKTITWSTSNSKIVKVDSKGVLTAVANGSATITAKSNNNKTATCKVTVCSWVAKEETNKTSCTETNIPANIQEGSSYIKCEASGYSKYRYIMYDKNNNKSYSSYIYDTPSAATSACTKAGGKTCNYERRRLYTQKTYTYKCS